MFFSGDFNSSDINQWLHHFAQKIQNVIQSDDQISLKQSKLKFHFVLQPEGAGVGTDDRSKDSIMKKKGVNTIINDDKNCFWYALSVSMNPKNAAMKDNRGPQKARKAFGLSLCQKARLQWDEPVSFEHIPLVEQALNINIYIIDMENIPVLGSAINIWDVLMYRNEDKHTEKHWLLYDDNHYHVINNITAFCGVRQFCDKCFKCFVHNKEFDNHDCSKITMKKRKQEQLNH